MKKQSTSQLLCVALLGTALGCGSSKKDQAPAQPAPAATPAQADDAFRATPPAPAPAPALHAPVPVKRVLANGLTVLSVPKPGLPLVNLSVVIRSGSAQDPKGMEGLAGFTGEMLKAGTAKYKAEAVADETETRGVSIDVDVDEDAITVSTTSLKDNFAPVFDIVTDILQHAAFDPKEMEHERRMRLAALQQANDDPQRAATRVFRKVVYGDHPYGHTTLGTEAAIKKMGRKDLQSYFAKHFRPANAAVVVVGDLTVDEAVAEVEKRLGAAGWKGAPGSQAAPAKPVELPAGLSLVPRPDAPQSQLFIGHLGAARSDPDYFGIVLTNAILGGLFNSRINMNLREAHGYTYGARSYFNFMRERGPFFVATGVRTDVTDLAIKEVLKEIDGMRTGEVTAEELANAKNRYSLSLPGYFQTVDGIAGMIANLYLFDLPLDYFQKLPDQINAVTAADVLRIAKSHLTPEKLSIVVVGDKSHVEAGLGDLQRGPVQLRDNEGNPLKDAKGAAKAAPAKTSKK